MMNKTDEKKIHEIYKHIRQLAEHCPSDIGKSGERFSILHAPLRRTVPILIVGTRPGPTALPHKDGYSEEDGPPPKNLLATRHNPYSIVARGLFSEAGGAGLISTAQSTDVSFFRSPTRQLNKACKKKFFEILEILNPSSIVAVGSQAKDALCRGTKLGNVEHFDGIPVTPVVHFSGITRASEEDIKASVMGLKKLFRKLR